jgi:predicted negative regulator of RcsB-dependent stress response
MMKHMNRVKMLSLAATAALGVGLVAGCEAETDGPADAAEDAAEASANAQEELAEGRAEADAALADSVKDATDDLAAGAQDALDDAEDAVENAMDDLPDLDSVDLTQLDGESLLGRVEEMIERAKGLISDGKFDQAKTLLDKLDGVKGKLPEAVVSQIDAARGLLDQATSLGGGAEAVGGMLGK